VLATYFQTADSAQVCAAWSAAADVILTQVWREAGLEAFEATLFALGKHGARELNLSSDIDVMIVAEGRDALAIEKGLRRFQQQLQHNGEFGFCYRLDFDLRPGGKMGPLITTPSQFQDYYWSQGETWERLALVRLREVAGHADLTRQTLELAKRFSYRKFLDFTLLEDLKALRTQVHQKGFVRRDDELHLKLEVGGIRDIELFVHSLLVLNGGKIPELQTRSTTDALVRLKDRGLLPAGESDFLLTTYWYYRQVENIIQSIDDRQTHSLSAALPPVPGLPKRAEIEARMRQVDQLVSGLLGAVDLESVHLPAEESAQREWLRALGFAEATIESAWDSLVKATALSHKNDRDERARREFLFAFVTEIARNRALDRDLGLSLLADFVRATRAKATMFTMLLRSPRLIQDLARLFCLSPYLGAIIASRPELLDHFILQLDENWSSDLESALQQMSERKLLTELWAANQYLSDRNLTAMCMRITQTADSICQQLLRQLKEEFRAAKLEIVALGKWAGHELGLRSDLDFIFVTPDATPNESDFKVARRFISRLSDPSKGGTLYDIDLRLRPSGQSGPLLVALDKLHEYWRGDAKAWERQAYLRARPLREDLRLAKDTLVRQGLNAEELAELREIRVKLLRKPSAETIDIKYAPGGLLDIEFVCQTAVLNKCLVCDATSTAQMAAALADRFPEWKGAAADLIETYNRLREFEQTLQLSSAFKAGEARRTNPVFHKAAALLGLGPEEAWTRLTLLLERSRQHLNILDPTHLQI
jgi:glutamate-ammonia-ligase adenylyltransferase